MSIKKIWAREILDSRGNPTVEVDLYTAKGNRPDLAGWTLAWCARHSGRPSLCVCRGWVGNVCVLLG